MPKKKNSEIIAELRERNEILENMMGVFLDLHQEKNASTGFEDIFDQNIAASMQYIGENYEWFDKTNTDELLKEINHHLALATGTVWTKNQIVHIWIAMALLLVLTNILYGIKEK